MRWVLITLHAELDLGIAMDSNTYNEWLQSLKEGDCYLAYICHQWHDDELKNIKINRLTDKSIYANEIRYRRNDGKLIGGNSYLPKPATEKEIAFVKLQNARKQIAKAVDKQLNKLTLEQSERVLAVFKELSV